VVHSTIKIEKVSRRGVATINELANCSFRDTHSDRIGLYLSALIFAICFIVVFFGYKILFIGAILISGCISYVIYELISGFFDEGDYY